MSRKKGNSARLRKGRSHKPSPAVGPLQRLLDRERGRVVEEGGKAGYERPANDAPTDEQRARGSFSYFHGRHQRTPVIETMHKRGQLTDREYRSLSFYRDQAALAERSPVKSCLDNSQGSGGDIPIGAAITSAILTTARLERDMGQLYPLARAVAVEDRSLSQWCVDRFGGRERYDGKGKFVAIVPLNEKRHMAMALMELRMASHRIVP